MINIPSNIFEQKLTDWLFRKLIENNDVQSEHKELELLFKLSKAQMCERDRSEDFPFIEDIRLDIEEKTILLSYVDNDNVQVKAYVNDVLRHGEKDKRQYALKASESYLQLASMVSSPWYLLRAVSVRSIKQLMTSDFLQSLCTAVEERFYSYWVAQIAKELRKSYRIDQLLSFKEIVVRNMQVIKDESHRDDERNCLDALLAIGAITIEEYHLQKACSYENEVDYVNNHKALHTVVSGNFASAEIGSFSFGRNRQY